MTTQTDLIRKIDFFEPLDQKIINKISRVCIERRYSKGEYILKQGESGLGLFFITSGSVKVEIEKNNAKVVVAQLQAEDFLGELSIIDNKPRSASIVCLEDTVCLLLTRDSFTKLVNKYPEIGIQMSKALAGRLRAMNEKIRQPLPADVEQIPAAAAQGAAPASETAAAPTPAAGVRPMDNTATDDAPAKNKVRDFLVDTFSFLYTVKAMTRFSVALVGCPVKITPEKPSPEVAQDSIGEVKLALFPASESRVIRIDAFDEGDFSATVLSPRSSIRSSAPLVSRFTGHLGRNECMWLHVPRDGEPWLDRKDSRR